MNLTMLESTNMTKKWMRDASTTFAAEDKSKAVHECMRGHHTRSQSTDRGKCERFGNGLTLDL
jgi:hypothetical protein